MESKPAPAAPDAAAAAAAAGADDEGAGADMIQCLVYGREGDNIGSADDDEEWKKEEKREPLREWTCFLSCEQFKWLGKRQ